MTEPTASTIPPFVTKKVGGIPIVGYVIAVALVVVVYRKYKKKKVTGPMTGAPTGTPPGLDTSLPSLGGTNLAPWSTVAPQWQQNPGDVPVTIVAPIVPPVVPAALQQPPPAAVGGGGPALSPYSQATGTVTLAEMDAAAAHMIAVGQAAALAHPEAYTPNAQGWVSAASGPTGWVQPAPFDPAQAQADINALFGTHQ